MKKLISCILSVVMVFSLTASAFADTMTSKQSTAGNTITTDLSETQLLDNSIVKIAYIPSVNKTGSNLLNETLDQGKYTADSSVLCNAKYTSAGQLVLSGSYGEDNFDVVANYVGNNENGNIDAFVGKDNNNVYDVVYCAIEREISKSSLYFNSMRDEYTTALKLYLRHKESGAFLIVELFNLPCLNIPENRVDSDVDVNDTLCWIERTFDPVDITETEITTRAANSSIIKTSTYTFNSFGYDVKDYVEYKLFWDFRDCSRGSSTTCNAGFELLRRYRTCEKYPNNNSSTYSSLFLYSPEFELYTGKNMAVMTEICRSSVTKGSSIGVTNPSVSFSFALTGLSVSVGRSIYLDRGGSNVSGTTIDIHDNSDGSYARAVKTTLDSSCTLKNVGNFFRISYSIGEYSGQSGLSNPTLYFNVYIGNELDVSTQSTYQKDMTQIIT